jgi:hypothetical protein
MDLQSAPQGLYDRHCAVYQVARKLAIETEKANVAVQVAVEDAALAPASGVHVID